VSQMPKLQLRVLTQDSVKIDEPVDMVIAHCVYAEMGVNSAVGELGILPGHMALSAVLGISPMRIQNDGEERMIAIHGGILDVRSDVVTITTEKAEWPEELELSRAEASLKETELLADGLDDNYYEMRSNQIAMRRALVRIEVSSYPLISRK